jgi:hypothetical protein
MTACSGGEESPSDPGLARRDFVRGAGVAGAIVWAKPVIRTARLEAAAGSPPPNTTTTTEGSTIPDTTTIPKTTTTQNPTTTTGGSGGTTTTQVGPTTSTTQAGPTTSTGSGHTTTTKGSTVAAEHVTQGTGSGHGGAHEGGVLAFTGINVTTITTLGAAAVAAGTAIVLASSEDELPGQHSTFGDRRGD